MFSPLLDSSPVLAPPAARRLSGRRTERPQFINRSAPTNLYLKITMVGQLVESNGRADTGNCTTLIAHSGPTFGDRNFAEQRKKHFTQPQFWRWFKFFNWSSFYSFCCRFKRWKLSRRTGQFFQKKLIDCVLRVKFLRSIGTVGFGVGFSARCRPPSILLFFFVFLYRFFICLRNCVKQLRLKVKWKHYLRDVCQIIHWWRYFCFV